MSAPSSFAQHRQASHSTALVALATPSTYVKGTFDSVGDWSRTEGEVSLKHFTQVVYRRLQVGTPHNPTGFGTNRFASQSTRAGDMSRLLANTGNNAVPSQIPALGSYFFYCPLHKVPSVQQPSWHREAVALEQEWADNVSRDCHYLPQATITTR
jgi:hypothetical protein